MEMFYLVLSIMSNSSVVMPEKYTKEQCDAAGKTVRLMYACVPAPKVCDRGSYLDSKGNIWQGRCE